MRHVLEHRAGPVRLPLFRSAVLSCDEKLVKALSNSCGQPACNHSAAPQACVAVGSITGSPEDGLLSVGELARMSGGRLRLGSMPPLGGESEPVRRIVTAMNEVTEGDVYWALRSREDATAACIEEAFSRGALGVVVAGRRVEPWAGRFVLEVKDAEQKLAYVVARCRRQRTGDVVELS